MSKNNQTHLSHPTKPLLADTTVLPRSAAMHGCFTWIFTANTIAMAKATGLPCPCGPPVPRRVKRCWRMILLPPLTSSRVQTKEDPVATPVCTSCCSVPLCSRRGHSAGCKASEWVNRWPRRDNAKQHLYFFEVPELPSFQQLECKRLARVRADSIIPR